MMRKKQLINGITFYCLQMFKTVEKSQKDFKELNYLLLGATLLCDFIFYHDNSL